MKKRYLLTVIGCLMTLSLSAYSRKTEDSLSSDYACNAKYEVYGAYTLWIAQEEGLEAAQGNYDELGVSDLPKGKVIFPDTPVRSGFKVGFNANMECMNGALGAEYTWFRSKNGLKTYQFNPYNGIATVVTSSLNEVFPLVAEVASLWDLQFNRVDALYGICVLQKPKFAMNVKTGLIFAWDAQQAQFRYAISSSSRVNYATVTQTYWGLGPYSRMMTTYEVWKGFGILLDIGVGFPWSRYDTNMYYSTLIDDTNLPYLSSKGRAFYNLSPMMDCSIGLCYRSPEMFVKKHCYLINAAVSLEQQFYHGHNHLFVSYAGVGKGALTFQGLTARLGFEM